MTTCQRDRDGFTLVELLVVVAIIGILVALLLPAVQAARESARRVRCSNNLKQLGTACLLHLEAHKHFPTGGWGEMWVGVADRGVGKNQPGGWIYNILPFIEQKNLHELGSGETGDPDRCAEMIGTPLPVLHCPSRRRVMGYPAVEKQATEPYPHGASLSNITTVARTDYAINGGTNHLDTDHEVDGPATVADASSYAWPDMSMHNGICHSRSEVLMAHVRDGASNTYLAGEKYINPTHYAPGDCDGDNATAYSGDEEDLIRWAGTDGLPVLENTTDFFTRRFGSPHSAGCNFVFCDNSVHLISYSIDAETHDRLANRQDGKPLDASRY